LFGNNLKGFEMQKSVTMNNVDNGKQFIYNNDTYTKVKISSHSNIFSSLRDYNIGVSLSGEEVIVLYWLKTVKIEVPDVKLSSVAIGKKFRYQSIDYIKVSYGEGKLYQYGLVNNEVCVFISDPFVELVD
jgi:hypothetical protein